jgi:predicted RND superfamily exporter protein
MTQPIRSQGNVPLIFVITAIFMILLAFLALSYVTNADNFTKIKQNQQTGQQSRTNQNQDLTSITCSMWRTMTTIPNVSPSPSTVQQMTQLCG